MYNKFMERIGIVYNNSFKNADEIAKKIKDLFAKKNIASEIFDLNNLKDNIGFAISICGDGTLLKTARFYSDYSIPVFGVNIGHLGFLSQVQSEQINEAVSQIEKSEFKIEERIMLEASVSDKKMYALNDIVIKGCTFARTSRFNIYINDKFVCEYLADGVIISTPTGSTAYNLSAGGPILYPTLEAITLVPICPHTISARPLVIPSSEKISVIAQSADLKLHINADGQNIIDCTEKITVKKASKKAHLMLLTSQNNEFYSILRQKLNWGTAPKP